MATGDPSGVGAGPSRSGWLLTAMSVWSHKGWDQTVFLIMGWHLGAQSLWRNTKPSIDFGMSDSDFSGLKVLSWAGPTWDFYHFWGEGIVEWGGARLREGWEGL